MTKRESLNRRLAREVLKHLSVMPSGTYKPTAPRPTFCVSTYEDDWMLMDEMAREVGWVYTDKNLTRTFSNVCKKMYDARVLERHTFGVKEKEWHRERNWLWIYNLQDKYLVRLNPEWKKYIGYSPESWSTPQFELEYLLKRAFL